jgi:predicted metal-binding protein
VPGGVPRKRDEAVPTADWPILGAPSAPMRPPAPKGDGLPPADTAETTRVYVCVTCRSDPTEEPRAGARLHDALATACAGDSRVSVVPVECLSVCKRPCTVSFAAPGKWTYVYGDLPADTAAAVIQEAARLYSEAEDGLIPWRLRPEPIRKGVVARVPPLPVAEGFSR